MTTDAEIADLLETLRSGRLEWDDDVQKAASLIDRLAGELAEANTMIAIERSGCEHALDLMSAASAVSKELAGELAAMQAANYDGGQAHMATLAQLAARDAELKVARRLAVRADCGCTQADCGVHGSWVGEDVDLILEWRALAKLTKKEAT